VTSWSALLTGRAALRETFETLAREADAFITLGATGAAPKGIPWQRQLRADAVNAAALASARNTIMSQHAAAATTWCC
jgi:hypothetical protein